MTHDEAVARALPRSLRISHGTISSEGRRGTLFSVLGRDGSLHLPAEVVAQYPPGTLFRVVVLDGTVELRPDVESER